MRYLSLVLIGIIAFGFAAFFRKLSVDKLNPYQLQMISSFVYITLIPLWVYLGGTLPKITSETYYFYFFAIMTALCGIIGAVAFSFLLKGNNEVGVTSALLSLSPVITLALSFIVFHEVLSFWKVVAFILAVLSVILVRF